MEKASSHTGYMAMALEVAQHAIGHTSPNPTVGAVIVKDGKVIGKGFTQPPGQAHAEVEALREAGDDARGATMYVTLEPCNHHGRTPPCTDAIIAAGIQTLYYAVADPNPIAKGGHQKLIDAGVQVHRGLFAAEAEQLNRFFFHHTSTKLPYVIAKFAMSLDGKIATGTGHSQWITGKLAREKGHELRHASDAIVVGSQTALLDNPSLTTRLPLGDPSHPLRVVLDSRGKLPTNLNLFNGTLRGQTLLATTDQISAADQARFEAANVETAQIRSTQSGRVDIQALLQMLGERDVQSVMVEGGSAVLGSFFDACAVDEVWAFVAPKIIGGNGAPGPIGGIGIDLLHSAFELDNPIVEQVGSDWLFRGPVKKNHFTKQTPVHETVVLMNGSKK